PRRRTPARPASAGTSAPGRWARRPGRAGWRTATPEAAGAAARSNLRAATPPELRRSPRGRGEACLARAGRGLGGLVVENASNADLRLGLGPADPLPAGQLAGQVGLGLLDPPVGAPEVEQRL